MKDIIGAIAGSLMGTFPSSLQPNPLKYPAQGWVCALLLLDQTWVSPTGWRRQGKRRRGDSCGDHLWGKWPFSVLTPRG